MKTSESKAGQSQKSRRDAGGTEWQRSCWGVLTLERR
jgi:hypothetical protein